MNEKDFQEKISTDFIQSIKFQTWIFNSPFSKQQLQRVFSILVTHAWWINENKLFNWINFHFSNFQINSFGHFVGFPYLLFLWWTTVVFRCFPLLAFVSSWKSAIFRKSKIGLKHLKLNEFVLFKICLHEYNSRFGL